MCTMLLEQCAMLQKRGTNNLMTDFPCKCVSLLCHPIMALANMGIYSNLTTRYSFNHQKQKRKSLAYLLQLINDFMPHVDTSALTTVPTNRSVTCLSWPP